MAKIDRKLLETAFVKPDALMFSEVMQRIKQDEVLPATRRRDMLSGLRRVAKGLNRAPQEVVADAKWLQPRLRQIEPAALKISAKSWSNALSDARAALVHCGIEESRNRTEDLSPDWRKLWKLVLASGDPTLQPSLARFVYFLNRLGAAPEQVCEDHALAYRGALALNELSKSPEVAYRAAVNGWNLAVRRIPQWPRQTTALPSRANRVSFPLEQFPESFQGDLNRFLHGLETPDVLDPLAHTEPLSPETIKQYRSLTIRFASALVKSGMPFCEIKNIEVLVNPQHAERGLRWLLSRNANRTSGSISQTARLLRMIARRYIRVDGKEQAAIDRMATRLAVKHHNGMTAKNRDRLRPLEDPGTLRRLLLLSEELFDRSLKRRALYDHAIAREDALAIAILLHCPIRRKNLARINIDENLQRPGDGRVFLVFEEEDVKNGRRIEFELPRELVRMIDRHLATRTFRLCPPGTPWLFPRRDGSKWVNESQLSARVTKRIRREIGITINPHLFRHLAARIWLDAHPGAYEAARRLLGHANLSQTLNAYAGFEAGTATRLFAELIGNARKA